MRSAGASTGSSASASPSTSAGSSSSTSFAADFGGTGISGARSPCAAVPVSVPPCRIRVISRRKISPPAASTSLADASDAVSTRRNAATASNTAAVQVSRRAAKSDMAAPAKGKWT